MGHLEAITRKTITLSDTMWQEVAAYQVANGLATEVEALRRLLQAGLRAEGRWVRLPPAK